MNSHKPKLLKHTTGQFFCKWGGRNHYLGVDRRAAVRRLNDEQLPAWARWWAERQATIKAARPASGLTVMELSVRFLDAKRADRAPDTLIHLANSLRLFLATFGELPAVGVRPLILQAFKRDLQESYAPRTVNHNVAAVKAMLRFGSRMELIPPVDFSVVETIRLQRPEPKGYDVPTVRGMIRQADSDLKNWLRVNWMTIARPTEMVRLVNQLGEWVQPWLFRPLQAKTGGRHLVLSAQAGRVLKRCQPRFHRRDSYGQACERACGLYPHPLRHGAATYLAQQGVARAEIDLALGHLPLRVSETYAPIDWQHLRETLSLLPAAIGL